MKEKTYKEQKTEQERGKKRYIVRLIETQEAEKQVEEFLEGKDEEYHEGSAPKRNTY